MPAQEHLSASTQARLATVAHLEALTQSYVPRLVSEAQSGDRKAEHLLALVYEEGRLVPKDFAAARTWMLKSTSRLLKKLILPRIFLSPCSSWARVSI